MKKVLIVGAGMLFLGIFVFVIYFFMRGDKPDDLLTQKNKLQTAIVVAENKLNTEKEKLGALTKGLEDSFPFGVNIQAQMRKSSDLVKQTDFLFSNPYGTNPELIVKNSLNAALINKQRKEINLLLLAWQKKTDILFVDKIDKNESEKIKKDMELIKSLISALSKIVKELNTKNSGLSQVQIDSYVARFPTVSFIDEILANVEISIQNHNTESNSSNSTGEDNTDGSISEDGANDADTSGSQNSSEVSVEDVVALEFVIAETQNQLTILHVQLAEVEEKIQQQTALNPTPAPLPTQATSEPVPAEIPTVTENQNTNTTFVPIYTKDRGTSKGIIIQPGPPRLIQGTDDH